MKHWIEVFFSHRSRGGLIPTEANWSDRQVYIQPENLTPDERERYSQGKWVRSAGVVSPDAITASFFGESVNNFV
jgi:hypothetical protein